MSAIQCKIEIPEISGLAENELTVGREFLLVCDGEFPRNLNQEKLQFVLKPEQKYQVQLLGFEFRTGTQADLKITSYKAGSHQFADLQITDGEQTLGLGAVQFQVQTVLPKPEQGQEATKVEAYGPVGPAVVGVPLLYWLILAAVLVAFSSGIVVRIYRALQRRNMLQRLREHDSALTPLAQFHQSLRRLKRENPVFFSEKVDSAYIQQCLDQSHEMLLLFLTRKYQVPALEWSSRLVIKDIKKYHPKLFQEIGADLTKLLKEFQRGLQDREQLKATDVLHLSDSARLLVEKMERVP